MKRISVQLSIASFILILSVFLSGCEVFYPSQLEEDYQANISPTEYITTTQITTTSKQSERPTETTTNSTTKSTAKSTTSTKVSTTTVVTTTTKKKIVEKDNDSKKKGLTVNPPLSKSGNSVYAYNQLSKTERSMYKKLVTGIENCKTKIHLTKGNPLSADEIFGVYFAVLADHPEFFHVGNQVGYEFDGNDTYINKINLDSKGNVVPAYNLTTYKNMKAKLDKMVDKLIAATSTMNNFDKVKYFHDYIVLNTNYVEGKPNSHNLYGVLIEGEAVCEGYARALQYLCNRVGIESLFITGRSKGQNHGWNLVKLDGEFYHIDATWNDPTGTPADYITYTYFGLTDKQISVDHHFSNADRSVSHYKKLPAAKGSKYNYHKYNKLYYTDSSNIEKELTKLILNAAKTKQKYVEVKFSNEKSHNAAYQNLKSGGFYNALNAAARKNKAISTSMNPFRYNNEHYTLTFEISYK